MLTGFRQGKSYTEPSKSTTGHSCEEPQFFIEFLIASWHVKARFSSKACISSYPSGYLTILWWYCVKKSCMLCWFNNSVFGMRDGTSYSIYHRSHSSQVETASGGSADLQNCFSVSHLTALSNSRPFPKWYRRELKSRLRRTAAHQRN